MNVDPGALFIKTALVQQQLQQQQMPTINITDENNQHVESTFVSLEENPILVYNKSFLSTCLFSFFYFQTNTDTTNSGDISFSQQMPTLPNVHSPNSGVGNPVSLPTSPADSSQALKFVYIPVCIETAIQRLQKFVQNRQLLCEVQCDEQKGITGVLFKNIVMSFIFIFEI